MARRYGHVTKEEIAQVICVTRVTQQLRCMDIILEATFKVSSFKEEQNHLPNSVYGMKYVSCVCINCDYILYIYILLPLIPCV